MKPTSEQLADPMWWDRNAPEGATKYSLLEGHRGFLKRLNNVDWFIYPEDCIDSHWVVYRGPLIQRELLVGRPEVRPPWRGHQDGLPPIGSSKDDCILGIYDGQLPFEVVAHAYGYAIVILRSKDSDGRLMTLSAKATDFYPIKSKRSEAIEQCQRDWNRILHPKNLSDYHHSIEVAIPRLSEVNQHGTQDWLPPVGVECEVSREGTSFFEMCVPKYHGIRSSVIEFTRHDGSKREAWVQREHTVFRPSESKLDQLIKAVQLIQVWAEQSPTTASEIAEICRGQQKDLGLLDSKCKQILDSLVQKE